MLDILSQQVPSDPALRTSSRTTLLQPGTPAANCSSPSNGKALVLQLSSDLDGTLSAKDDQGPVVLAVLPDRPQQSPEHASSGSITRAWLADVARGGSKEARGPHAALANCKQAARVRHVWQSYMACVHSTCKCWVIRLHTATAARLVHQVPAQVHEQCLRRSISVRCSATHHRQTLLLLPYAAAGPNRKAETYGQCPQ